MLNLPIAAGFLVALNPAHSLPSTLALQIGKTGVVAQDVEPADDRAAVNFNGRVLVVAVTHLIPAKKLAQASANGKH